LKLIPDDSKYSTYSLKRLVELACTHKAFETKSILSELASKYNIKIIYIPKFHSELSPIEGVWAHEKQYIRKNTDQTFASLRKLLNESRSNLYNHHLIPKLWRRFWRTLEAYNKGEDFLKILNDHFGVKCQVGTVGHRQIQPYFYLNIEL